MLCTCPYCGRGMLIEKSAGDFPVPCHYCGALIRRRRKSRSHSTPKPSSSHPAATPIVIPYSPSDALSRGMLARLLIDRAPHPALASNNSHSHAPSDGFLQRAISESRRRAVNALSWAGLFAALIALTMWIFKIPSG